MHEKRNADLRSWLVGKLVHRFASAARDSGSRDGPQVSRVFFGKGDESLVFGAGDGAEPSACFRNAS